MKTTHAIHKKDNKKEFHKLHSYEMLRLTDVYGSVIKYFQSLQKDDGQPRKWVKEMDD